MGMSSQPFKFSFTTSRNSNKCPEAAQSLGVSPRSILDSTVSCDVTERHSPRTRSLARSFPHFARTTAQERTPRRLGTRLALRIMIANFCCFYRIQFSSKHRLLHVSGVLPSRRELYLCCIQPAKSSLHRISLQIFQQNDQSDFDKSLHLRHSKAIESDHPKEQAKCLLHKC